MNEKTILKAIEWRPSRNGLLAPVGSLEPVLVDGVNVTSITLFNKEYIKEHKLGVGDEVVVRMTNPKIPGLVENLTNSDTYIPPTHCPYCNKILVEVGRDLYCYGKRCKPKKALSISHFCTVMKITGVSYNIAMRLITMDGFNGIEDLYILYRKKVATRNALGDIRANLILEQIEKSRTNCTLTQFIYSLGLTGELTAKQVSKYCKNDIDTFITLAKKSFDWNDAGLTKYKSDELNYNFYTKYKSIIKLSRVFYIEPYIEPEEYNDLFVGMTFVIYGETKIFENRNEIIDHIELHGGRVIGELNDKITYLIDCGSMQKQIKNAKNLGVEIISEEDFRNMLGDEL